MEVEIQNQWLFIEKLYEPPNNLLWGTSMEPDTVTGTRGTNNTKDNSCPKDPGSQCKGPYGTDGSTPSTTGDPPCPHILALSIVCVCVWADAHLARVMVYNFHQISRGN